jgi:hypothetical protein
MIAIDSIIEQQRAITRENKTFMATDKLRLSERQWICRVNRSTRIAVLLILRSAAFTPLQRCHVNGTLNREAA